MNIHVKTLKTIIPFIVILLCITVIMLWLMLRDQIEPVEHEAAVLESLVDEPIKQHMKESGSKLRIRLLK